jgi:hypothetical protein
MSHQGTRNRVSQITGTETGNGHGSNGHGSNGHGSNGHGEVLMIEGSRSRSMSSSERSMTELLRTLSHEGADLVRKELALARAEMFEKLETFRSASISMAVGGVLLLGSLMLLLQAVNHGLTALLAQGMDLDIAVWLAPLILCCIVGFIGFGVFKGGKKRMAEESFVPEATMQTLSDDSRWARRKVREVKEDIRHG